MEAGYTNANGYLNSEMRGYLTGVFLTGLTAAGVPDTVLWTPTRYVANKGTGADGEDTITDALWLPTRWEMFGISGSVYETAANQARLEYYTSDALRIKYNTSNAAASYWLASPYTSSATEFCNVYTDGYWAVDGAPTTLGCAPAFCVK
jgi:hypothetical protein